MVPCRGCGRGQYQDDSGKCVYCQDGSYQMIDHFGTSKRAERCEKCEAGYYAPKALEFSHFDSMPEFFVTDCQETNDLGNVENCDVIPGFHVNKEGLIESGKGLPVGAKLLLRVMFSIDDPAGGSGFITYRLRGAAQQEYAKVLISGSQVGPLLQHNSDAWQELKLPLPPGDHSLDIELMSDF